MFCTSTKESNIGRIDGSNRNNSELSTIKSIDSKETTLKKMVTGLKELSREKGVEITVFDPKNPFGDLRHEQSITNINKDLNNKNGFNQHLNLNNNETREVA